MHKMKSASLVLASFLALSATAVTFTAGNSEVVIASKPPPVVRFAAAEATNFLSRVLGAPVPIVNEPSEGRASLVLGMNKWSRTAGIDLSGSPRDSFAIKTSGGNVFVAGIDSPWANPAKANVLGYERGTLMGVYAFLEDYAGCRFYFPGEFGEIAPRAKRIEVPDVDRTVSPAMPIRTWHFKDGAEWDESLGTDFPVPGKTLHWLRVRAASARIPCCHGTNNMKLSEKFGETHPEYFALRKNGTRCSEAPKSIVGGHLGHLCYSSGVRDAIVDVCVERFAKGAKYVDIMPNDGMQFCECEKCQAAYAKSPEQEFKATWLVWDYTRYVAEKLLERGARGYVTQMVYAQHGGMPPPDLDLPTNVYVMVAVNGPRNPPHGDSPHSWDRQLEKIRAWRRKSANPVWTWTYPGKYGANKFRLAGIPSACPRSTGEYYKALAEDTMGTFAQYGFVNCWLYNYLNYYVLSHVMWNPGTDVAALIAEHNRLMFGAAERPMSAFFSILERKWVVESRGRTEITEIGPVVHPPNDDEMWSAIYGPDTLSRLDSLLKEAASLVKPGSIEARRVALFRRSYYDPLVEAAYRGTKMKDEVAALKWKSGSSEPMELVPFKTRSAADPADRIRAAVRVERTKDSMIVRFGCRDGLMDDASFSPRERGDADTWKDYSAEIFVNPSGDRTNYCHVVVNLSGAIYEERCYKRVPGIQQVFPGWNTGAAASVELKKDGWTMTVTIPLSRLAKLPTKVPGKRVKDEIPMEFAINRITRSGKGHGLYTWSPYVIGFHEIMQWGTVIFEERE